METLDLFSGTRTTAEFVLPIQNGEGRAECTIKERWQELVARSLRCGAKWRRKLTSRVGMELTQSQDLEGLVKGSLGFKSLAAFESQIRANTSSKTLLSTSAEIEEVFEFEAPKCGMRVVRLFQLQMMLHLDVEERTLFGKKTWNRDFLAWIDRIHDASETVAFLRECGCEQKESEDDKAGNLLVDLGEITLQAGFLRQGDSILVPTLSARLPAQVASKEVSRVRLQRRMIPSHLLFLARKEGELFEAGVYPYDVEESAAARVQARAGAKASVD